MVMICFCPGPVEVSRVLLFAVPAFPSHRISCLDLSFFPSLALDRISLLDASRLLWLSICLSLG